MDSSSFFTSSKKEGVRLEVRQGEGSFPSDSGLSGALTTDERQRLEAAAEQLASYRREHSSEHMDVMENEIRKGKSVEEADKQARMMVGE